MHRKSAAIALTLTIGAQLALSQVKSTADKKFDFEFTNVVDTTNGFHSFGNFPAINNHTEVAFTATQDGTGPGVFRAHQGNEKLKTIASGLDGLSFFGDDVAINVDGVVAFGATTTTNSRAIFKGDGKFRLRIADSIADGLVRIGLGSPSINRAGTVAFCALLARAGSPGAIITANGGPLTTLLSTGAGFRSFQNAAINDDGTVAFSATLADGNFGVFALSENLVDVVDTVQHREIDSFSDPVINNTGAIAVAAFVLPSGAPEILTGLVGAITPRNDPANPQFASAEHPSFNNRNAVAFSAIPTFAGDKSPTGIFLEVSGGQSLIPVVRPGDKLFGSTVDHVDLGRFALNDRFELAFSYTLTDGRSGIGIAAFNGDAPKKEQP